MEISHFSFPSAPLHSAQAGQNTGSIHVPHVAAVCDNDECLVFSLDTVFSEFVIILVIIGVLTPTLSFINTPAVKTWWYLI